jgi:hypothetical protein
MDASVCCSLLGISLFHSCILVHPLSERRWGYKSCSLLVISSYICLYLCPIVGSDSFVFHDVSVSSVPASHEIRPAFLTFLFLNRYSLLFPIISVAQFYVRDTNAERSKVLLPVVLTVAYCICVAALVTVGLLYPVGKVRLLTLELADMKGFPSQFYCDVVVSEIRARCALRRLRASLYKTLWLFLGKQNAKEVWKCVTKYSGESLVDTS